MLEPYRGVGYTGWEFNPAPLALGGWEVADLRAGVDAWIAASTVAPEWALVNIGVNDMSAPATAQAAYEADLAYVLDAVNAAWPSCRVRLSYVWKRGSDADANTMAGWIDNVLASRSAWAEVGDDERVWLKGSDDGATMTSDGVHYSVPTGQNEKAARMLTAMGY